MKVSAVLGMAVMSLVSVAAQEVYKPGNGVSLPTVIKSVKPDYTPEAKAQRIEGTALLDAAKEWKFKPGMKDGKAVAVRIQLEMGFRLQ